MEWTDEWYRRFLGKTARLIEENCIEDFTIEFFPLEELHEDANFIITSVIKTINQYGICEKTINTCSDTTSVNITNFVQICSCVGSRAFLTPRI